MYINVIICMTILYYDLNCCGSFSPILSLKILPYGHRPSHSLLRLMKSCSSLSSRNFWNRDEELGSVEKHQGLANHSDDSSNAKLMVDSWYESSLRTNE